MEILVIIINFSIGLIQCYQWRNFTKWDPVLDYTAPWLGILLFKQHTSIASDPVNGAIGVTLIKEGVAIAHAGDISLIKDDLPKKNTRVYFQKTKYEYSKWYCNVRKYIIHPEYNDYTVSTIALVILQDTGHALWEPIKWPTFPNINDTQIYSFEMQIVNNKWKQVRNQMIYVDFSACVDFYVRSGLNIKTLIPVHYNCFKYALRHEKCVCDSGITLATKPFGTWELLGISIHGPGCGDPARYIDFHPYIPWIKSVLQSPNNYRTSFYRRASNETAKNPENNTKNWKEKLFSSYEDSDQMIVKKIDNTRLLMIPAGDYRYGSCYTGLHGNVLYRDYGTITAKINKRFPMVTIGLYSVSVYDLTFANVSCILASLKGGNARWSKPEVEIQTGFKTDVDYLDLFVKTIQIKRPRGTPKPKILYLKDNYQQINEMETTTFTFKFKFVGKCVISVVFFGRPAPPAETESEMETEAPPDDSEAELSDEVSDGEVSSVEKPSAEKSSAEKSNANEKSSAEKPSAEESNAENTTPALMVRRGAKHVSRY